MTRTKFAYSKFRETMNFKPSVIISNNIVNTIQLPLILTRAWAEGYTCSSLFVCVCV